MRALVLEEYGRVAVREVTDPRPGPGQVLVQIVATGICGSDVHGYTGENGRRKLGQVMGHETVGRIRALGEGVVAPAIDSVVVINPVLGCGNCAECAAAQAQQCATKSVLGVTPSLISAFAELVVVPAENAVPFDASAPIEQGALVEPLAVGFHAARRAGTGIDDRVLVIGAGPIGQACLLAALRLGVGSIAVSEPDSLRRGRAAELGAMVVDPSDADLDDRVRSALGGSATVVLDAVGSNQSLESALRCSSPGARIVLVGMAQPQLELNAYEVSTQERTLIGSFCYSPAEFVETAIWVGQHSDQVRALIDERVSLDEAQNAFTRLASGQVSSCKIMVFPQGNPGRR